VARGGTSRCRAGPSSTQDAPRGTSSSACSAAGVKQFRLHERRPRRPGSAARTSRRSSGSRARFAGAGSTSGGIRLARRPEGAGANLRLLKPGGDHLRARPLYEHKFTVRRGGTRYSTRTRRACLLRRVIPCLDVDKGPASSKATNLRRHSAMAGRTPVELAMRYEAEGADELRLPGHHRVARGARDDRRPGPGRTADDVFNPRSRSAAGSSRPVEAQAVPRRRRPTKVSGGTPPAGAAAPELLGRACRGVRRRRAVVLAIRRPFVATDGEGYEVFVSGGRTGDGPRRPSSGAREAVERGAGEILLTSMDRERHRGGL